MLFASPDRRIYRQTGRLLGRRLLTTGMVLVTAVPMVFPLEAAAPGPFPGFDAAICRAVPPANAVGRLRDRVGGLRIEPAAATALSNEDQAEFMFKLGLLQGHLIIGKALVDAGQTKAALPHFGHPVREIYDDISGQLPARGIAPFEETLVKLEVQAAKAPTGPETAQLYDEVIKWTDAARLTIPAQLRDDPRFGLAVVAEIAEVSVEEYGEAITAGKIDNFVEYHDASGYLRYASLHLKQVEAMPNAPAAQVAKVRADLNGMLRIVAPLNPPTRPPVSVSTFRSQAAELKKDAAG